MYYKLVIRGTTVCGCCTTIFPIAVDGFVDGVTYVPGTGILTADGWAAGFTPGRDVEVTIAGAFLAFTTAWCNVSPRNP